MQGDGLVEEVEGSLVKQEVLWSRACCSYSEIDDLVFKMVSLNEKVLVMCTICLHNLPWS